MNKIDFKVTSNKTDKKNELELAVEAPPTLADKAYTIALRDISSNIDIPGFRKGKAPKDVIEQKVGKGYISQKAFESVFYDILIDVAIQEKIDVVDVVQVTSFELLPVSPLKFTVTVEVKPEVKLGKYKDLKVKVKKMVYEKETFLNKTLNKIAANLLTMQKVEDRPVKEGDLVTLDFESQFEDGSPVPGGTANNFQVLLEKDKFLPEFVAGLQGVKVGERKEIEVTFPDKSGDAFASKKALFKVLVMGIEEKVIPAIDDELAKKVGIEDLAALKKKIEEQMNEMQDQASQRELENKLVDEIVGAAKFEISERMLEKESNFLLQDLRANCQSNGLDWETFKKDEANKEIFDKAREAAKKRISIDLILSAVIREEKISASPEELEVELKTKVAQLGDRGKSVENDPRFKSNVELIFLRNKAVDFLLKNNTPEWEEEITTVIPD